MCIRRTSITLFTACLMLLGCAANKHTSSSQTADRPSKGNLLQTIQSNDLDGSWLTLFHCNGYDFWLSTRFVTTGNQIQATLSGKPTQSEVAVAGLSRRYSPINANYQVQLDKTTGAFSFLPSGSHASAPHFTGVFIPKAKRFAAEVRGKQWNTCSNAIIFPEKRRSKIEDQLADAPSALSSMFGRSSIGVMYYSMTARNQLKQSCDEETRCWVGRYVSSLPEQYNNLTDLKPYISAMYEDGLFKSAFGSGLRDMSLKDGQMLARKISTKQQCGLLQADIQQHGQAITQLLLPLSNHAQLSRNEVVITNYTRSVYRQWLAGLHQQLQQSIQHPVANPSAQLSALDKLQPWIKNAQLAIQPIQSYRLDKTLEQRRQQLYTQLIRDRLDSQIASTYPNMASLEALAQFIQSNQREFSFLAPEIQVQINKTIDSEINTLAPQAVSHMAETSIGLSGYSQLSEWRLHYASTFHRLSPPVHKTVDQTIETRQEQLTKEILASYQSTYQQEVLDKPYGKAALAAGVAFENRLKDKLLSFRHSPQFQAFAVERSERRAQDLTAASQKLTQLVAIQPHLSGLDNIKNTYLLQEDYQHPAAKKLIHEITLRRKELAPFDGLPGGDYLNALYTGDFVLLNRLDDAFVKPYQEGLFKTSIDNFVPIMDGYAKLAGININTKKVLDKSLESISLIVPVFAVYLVDYQTRYRVCLEPSAVKFKVTTSSKTVYQNGYGDYLYTVPHPDQVEYFKVNRRFKDVFEQVGLSHPNSGLGLQVDSMFGDQGRINVSDIASGTREMMENYECHSPTITQLEDNMLKHFDQYLQNRKQISEAMLDR